jgi:hypothetical protein
MTLSLTWTLDQTLLTNLVKIVTQQDKTLESVLSEAVQLYLENQPIEQNSFDSNSTENNLKMEENTSQFLLEIANSFAKGLTDEDLATLPADGAEHHDRYLHQKH